MGCKYFTLHSRGTGCALLFVFVLFVLIQCALVTVRAGVVLASLVSPKPVESILLKCTVQDAVLCTSLRHFAFFS